MQTQFPIGSQCYYLTGKATWEPATVEGEYFAWEAPDQTRFVHLRLADGSLMTNVIDDRQHLRARKPVRFDFNKGYIDPEDDLAS